MRVGRAPIDETAIRLLEQHNPDVEFDWTRILKAPPAGEGQGRRDSRDARDRDQRGRREARPAQRPRSAGGPPPSGAQARPRDGEGRPPAPEPRRMAPQAAEHAEHETSEAQAAEHAEGNDQAADYAEHAELSSQAAEHAEDAEHETFETHAAEYAEHAEHGASETHAAEHAEHAASGTQAAEYPEHAELSTQAAAHAEHETSETQAAEYAERAEQAPNSQAAEYAEHAEPEAQAAEHAGYTGPYQEESPDLGELEAEADRRDVGSASYVRLGAEGLVRLRARYAEVMARIAERPLEEAAREELKLRAERLNPDAWVTADEVTAALEQYETVFEGLRGVIGRYPRRRPRGRR